MSLSGEQYRELCEALMSAYPTDVSLEQMARFQLNVNLNQVAGGDNLGDIVFALIRWFDSVGKVDDLTYKAQAYNPGNPKLTAYVKKYLTMTQRPISSEFLEPIGGAVPLGSHFYVARQIDSDFYRALLGYDGTITLRGDRQMGKTSLLARGMQCGREIGTRVVLTDLQGLSKQEFNSCESLLLGLMSQIVDDLGLDIFPQAQWNPNLGPTQNLTRFLQRNVLQALDTPFVWFIDETDKLLGRDYCGELFGLFRSWHNKRATDPSGPWKRLTLVISHTNDEHSFISDTNQSPFNIATQFILTYFNLEEVARMNELYGSPLATTEALDKLYAQTAGHPYHTRFAFNELVKQSA